LSGWLGDLELDDLCTKYNIDVIYTTDIDEQVEIIIGHAVCYQIDTINKITGEIEDIMDIADSIDTGILFAVTPFVDDYGSLKAEFLGQKFLYIDSLYIDTQYRNKGIGSMALKYIIEEPSDLGSIITVFPDPIESDDPSDEYKAVLKRLIALYESMGFDKVNDKVWAYKS
jgi:ribosomal protein S18 acetylase RimI-like enzyme